MLAPLTKFAKNKASFFFLGLVLCIVIIPSKKIAAQQNAAEDKKYVFSIEEKSLSDALQEFSLATDLQLISLSEIFEGKTSTPLRGEHTAREAIQILLSGTTLKYEFISKEILVISQGIESTPVPRALGAVIEEQNVDTDLEVVTVTGSRVPRSEFDMPYPTQSLGPLFIEHQSATTVGDAINSLPVMCESEYSLSVSGSAGNIGEAYGDLYCLGSQRTLTLINGRRTISSNDPSSFNTEPGLQVDLNMIPRIMVKNIEVIGVGSAPVYGSDAVAGTINILLKENFEGFEFDLQQSISALSDAKQRNASLLLGKNFSKADANITLGYEYHKQLTVAATDREYTRLDRDYVFIDPDVDDPFSRNYRFADDIVNPLISAGGIPTPSNGPPLFAEGENAFLIPDTGPLVFGENGALRVFNRGSLTRALNQRVGGDGVREQLYRTLRVPIERHVLNLTTRFNLTDNAEAFSEFQFYRSRSSSISNNGDVVPTFIRGDLPADGDNIFISRPGVNSSFNSVRIARDNPFLTREQIELLNLTGGFPTDIFYLHKDWRNIIDPETSSKSDIYRAVLGLRGEEQWRKKYWNWEITYSQGVSKSDLRKRRVEARNFARSINAIRNEDGEIVCKFDVTECIPLNPFGIQASNQAIEYISQEARDRGKISQEVLTASVRGELAELDGGPLRVVLGAEYRKEDAEYIQANITEPRSSSLDENTLDDFANEFHTNELFLEAVAPIVGDQVIPLVSKLELEANLRGIDNSNAGTDSTWATGGRITFENADYTLIARGNIGRSVRAPSLFELFRPFTLVNTELTDPCDRTSFEQGGGNTVRERVCVEQAAALAVPYNSSQFDALIPDAGPLRLGGTPNLKNEQANSYTLGFVLDVTGFEQLRFSADLVDIEVKDAIVERDLNRLATLCYDQDLQSACDDIVRDLTTFQLFAIRNAYENIGQISLTAIQYNLLYAFNIGEEKWIPGEFSLDASAYNLREFIEQDRQRITNRLGSLDYPKWRAAATLAYSLQDFEFSWTSHYTSEVSIALPFESEAAEPPIVDSYWLHHMSMSYAFNSKLRARFGVRNILDAAPPNGLPSSQVGSAYDAIGRYYSAGLNFSF